MIDGSMKDSASGGRVFRWRRSKESW